MERLTFVEEHKFVVEVCKLSVIRYTHGQEVKEQ
jgi:hypothetical protein